MGESVVVRALGSGDLADYKLLRDEMLAAHPEAFTSDADTEAQRPASDYAVRFGLHHDDDGQFVLGAQAGTQLVGAIGCEHDERVKVRHIGHVIGMMVRPAARGRGVGAQLLVACIAQARRAGLEMLTLTVTAGNASAVQLYERHGFVGYGTLARAIKVGDTYHDKVHMALAL